MITITTAITDWIFSVIHCLIILINRIDCNCQMKKQEMFITDIILVK